MIIDEVALYPNRTLENGPELNATVGISGRRSKTETTRYRQLRYPWCFAVALFRS